MRKLLSLFLFLYAFALSCEVHATSAAKSISDGTSRSPNVLFISVDDLNDWIGCLDGHPQALTPNMDRLAERGVLFANAHCAAPACNPSRAAVFTGMHPTQTGVWSNTSRRIHQSMPDAMLLPMAFAQAGYHTMGAGKLLHGNSSTPFNEYFNVEQRWSPLGGKQAVEYTSEELPSKGTDNPRHVLKDSMGRTVILPLNRVPSDRAPNETKGESFDWGPFDVPDSDFGDTQITDWAIQQIEKHSNKPLFLGVGYYRPHIPLWAPKRFFDRFKNDPGKLPPTRKNDLDDLSASGKKWALDPIMAGRHSTVVRYDGWQQAVEAYLACVTYVDHEIGRLLDTLDQSGMADNTVIVLWSDHGWHLGEKEHWGKWTGWERSTRVPMIIVPPKNSDQQFARGMRSDQAVGLIDLYPTLVELCDVTGPDQLDGRSLVPLLIDPKKKTHRTAITFFDPGNVSIRDQQWRYIRYADGTDELYDLKSDPNEWNNLANDAKFKTERTRMIQALEKRLSH
jgi:arylsulfatase A-like enzyme